MYYLISLLFFNLILHLMGCSDSVPTTISTTHIAQEAQNATGKLRLDIPSLMGWGEVSEVKMTLGDTMELLATLENSQGESFPNHALYIFSEQGNFFTENNLLTDHNGQATSLLLATVVGSDKITVSTDSGLSTTLAISVTEPNRNSSSNQAIPTLKELPGVVSWQTLAQVTLKNDIPYFDSAIEELNGQIVKIQGFMMPLDNAEKQKHFILSINPPSCFFCLPAGAEGLVEVYTQPGIEFSFDPIIMSGTFAVLKDDEMGLFYRLQNAQQSAL